MAKVEECEFYANGLCKAILDGTSSEQTREGTLWRDDLCTNANKASCCYLCSRKDSCEISCDYLENSTKKTIETMVSSHKLEGNSEITQRLQACVCAKCGGEMVEGETSSNFRVLKTGDLSGDPVDVYYCRECGFIEFYKIPSSKEPWRLKKQQKAQFTKLEEAEKKTPLTETARKKMVR